MPICILGPNVTWSQFRIWDVSQSQFQNWANLSRFWNWDQKLRPVPDQGRVRRLVPELGTQCQNWTMTLVPPWPPFQHSSPFWHWRLNGTMFVSPFKHWCYGCNSLVMAKSNWWSSPKPSLMRCEHKRQSPNKWSIQSRISLLIILF
jgi:hypothetical protein